MALSDLWGEGRDLDALQMATRAFVVWWIALALVRVSGLRSGRRASFDMVIMIVLGTVLGRPVFGAAPLWPIVAAATMMVVLHRVVAMWTAQSPRIEHVIKGKSVVLYDGAEPRRRAMQLAGVSQRDLEEAVRSRSNTRAIEDVREVRLETSGDLTVIDR